MRQTKTEDQEFLNAALRGYQIELDRINMAMANITQRLRGRSTRTNTGGNTAPTIDGTTTTATAPRKRRISAEGRRRIAEAQRKRWAAQKKDASGGGKTMAAGRKS